MPSTIRPGDVLADRYLLIDLLSEAGDGRFWRAHDRVLARHVAIHVLPTGTQRAEELLEAARGCARLTDRRFLRVLDAEIKGSASYVVTEWGTGTSLQLMLEHAPLAPRRAAWMVGEVAGAMAAAHAVGVTHGRLAPENVLVDLSGTVRIIGAQVDAALKGLPRATEADDVHELVSLLYAGLTGRWPGRSPSAMPTAPLEGGRVLRPRQVRAGIPRTLDEICDDILNSGSPPRAPYDLTTARGVADYLREYVGDPASMAAAEAERGSTATGQFPPVPAALLTPMPPVLPHDARGGRGGRGSEDADAAEEPTEEPSEQPTEQPGPAPTQAFAQATPTDEPTDEPTDASSDDASTETAGSADPQPADSPTAPEPTHERIRVLTAEENSVPTDHPDEGQPDPLGAPDGSPTDPAAADARSDRPAGAAAGAAAAAGSGTAPRGAGDAGRTKVRARPADTFDVPTQAGVPIFDDDSADVAWVARRSEKPPPPPDFEDPPERPLFAPETEAQAEARRRAQETTAPPAEDYWPWATGHTTGAVLPHPVRDPGARRADRPGRTWLQLAGFLGSLVALLLVVVVGYQIFAPGGDSSSEGGGGGSSDGSSSAAPTPTTGAEVTGLSATTLDPAPDGNGEENDEDVPSAVDGDPATEWTTVTYLQQLGPSGLKEGVGVQIDLGEERALSRVDLSFVGAGTSASLFLSPEQVDSVDDLQPVGTVEGAGETAQVQLDGASGRYLVVWLTALPEVSDGFQGGLSEVRVFE